MADRITPSASTTYKRVTTAEMDAGRSCAWGTDGADWFDVAVIALHRWEDLAGRQYHRTGRPLLAVLTATRRSPVFDLREGGPGSSRNPPPACVIRSQPLSTYVSGSPSSSIRVPAPPLQDPDIRDAVSRLGLRWSPGGYQPLWLAECS